MPAKRATSFTIRFEQAEEGGFVISIPEMPGCLTQAETFEEGLAMVKDALQGLLAVAVEEGNPVPEPFRDLIDELVPASELRECSARGRQAARSPAR